MVNLGTRKHLDWWQRIWVPEQSRPSSPQSSQPAFGQSAGWDRPFIREMLGPGDQLFPGASGVGGGPHPWPGVSDIGQGQPGMIGASHALAILLLGGHIIDQPTSLCFPGHAARQGPPPSDGDPARSLHGPGLRSHRAASGPRHSSWEDLPSRLADNAMKEGGEDNWSTRLPLGLPEVAFCPQELRSLAIGDGR